MIPMFTLTFIKRRIVQLMSGILVAQLFFPSFANAVFYLVPFDRIDNSTWLFVTGAPGEKVTAQFWMVNDNDEDAVFSLDLVDAKLDSQGEFDSITSFHDKVGGWGKLSSNQVDVEGKTALLVEAVFDIPADTPLGEYWGAIVTKPIVVNKDTVSEASGVTGISIKTEIEQGMRVRLTLVSSDDFVPSSSTSSEPSLVEPSFVDSSPDKTSDSIPPVVFYILSGVIVVLGSIATTVHVVRARNKKK